MNRTLYNILLHIGLPFIAVRLWLRSRKATAYGQRIGERFAFGLAPMQRGGIWVHAVSVGESIAAAPMIRALLARYPQLPIIVTCMTPTGSERIQSMFASEPRIQHCYLPYDFPWAARRFLDHIQPRIGVFMETELWPNHIHQCAARGIPTVLANARLSERSARGYARFAKLTRPMLKEINLFAVQTQTEAQRFRDLGARPECVAVTGSIKFDLTIDPQLLERAAQQRLQWHTTQRPVWIAASTHPGEDEVVLAAHRTLLQAHPDALLILVPRHLERFNSVFDMSQQQGFNTVRRSTAEPVTAETSVLVGDTMGELLFLYALADIAFVGGSLVPTGGHNLLEPAALDKPLVSGPHLFNFLEIAAMLSSAGALEQVSDAPLLAATVKRLIEQPERAKAMADAGLGVIKANQGALEKLLEGIARLLR